MSEGLSRLALPEDLPPFADRRAARSTLERLGSRAGPEFARLLPRLLSALAEAADPDRSLVNLERFADQYGPEFFAELEKDPRVIEILVTLFSGSQFLTEILLRNPRSLALLHHRQSLTQRKTIEQIQAESEAALQAAGTQIEKLDALRRYQRSELLRIGASDFLALYDLRTVVSQLSRMAVGLVRTALALAAAETGISADGFVVLAMGKLGGWELNYSSDIDLLFIARQDAAAYLPLAQRLIEILASPTSEGFLYRVDVRLRPWGEEGPLVASLPAYLQYIEQHARLWEKQALLKVRPVAGELALGEELRRKLEVLIYHLPAEQVRAGIFAMKQRSEEFLRQRGRHWGEVKLGAGSIRDVEFVVQALQMTHVHVRTRATLKAIPRLRDDGLLSPTEAGVLTEGYIFLRTIEHYLQVMDYQQTYTLPSDPSAIVLLARRLGFEGPQAGENFVARYEQHCQAIRAIFMAHVGGESMAGTAAPEEASRLLSHLERMDASYAETFSPQEIRRHAEMAGQLDDQHLAIVSVDPGAGSRWKITIVAYDYPGELSIICGLMFVHGLNILDGNAFTYEPLEETNRTRRPAAAPRPGRGPGRSSSDLKRKIVDVFTVQAVRPAPADLWERYRTDLAALLDLMRRGQRREARGELAKRVGAAYRPASGGGSPLLPIGISIDNAASERYTLLHIDSTDTVGFLYELTNALAFYRIYIARVLVQSKGTRVQDSLYVTDEAGHKIVAPERQRELRAAIVLIKHFSHLLPRSPNPEAALLHFREFIDQLFQRPGWPDELASLERPEVLDALAQLLGVSDFLWDDFLRMQHTNLFPVVSDLEALKNAKSRQQLQAELGSTLQKVHAGPQPPSQEAAWLGTLNAFKDREMFRIDMRHILGHAPEFWQFSDELTDLAEVVVNAAYHLAHEDLRSFYGPPRRSDGGASQMAVCGLGKFGGHELGFASDIELMFIYDENGQTDGPQVIPDSEFYEKLVQAFLRAMLARQEGIFEVDLRLRPYGKSGSLAVSLEAFRQYFCPAGPAWAYERQALVRLRPAAGDEGLGRTIQALRDEFVYNGEPFDVTAMRAMRERQIRHLVTGGTFNAKYSPGGLLDVEYLVQGLQINYGAGDPSVRQTNIREALSALVQGGYLSSEDFTRLRKAHTFLRWLIDSLRVVRGNAKDMTVPPADSEEFAFLTRRLRYGKDTAMLSEELNRYTSDIQELNRRLLG